MTTHMKEIAVKNAHFTVADDPKMIPVEQWGCFEIPGPPKVIIWGEFEEKDNANPGATERGG